MSSTIDSKDDTNHTPWDKLTTARQRVAKSIAHVHGPATFNRPDLKKDVEESTTVETVIDDRDRVLTSLKYTRLLNDLEDDGYLEKEFQGGKNPIILYTEYDKSRDNLSAAPFGDTSTFHALVAQVLDCEGITRDILDEVRNPYDFNEVREAVNRAVGRTVLVPNADPSEYRFTKETYGLVSAKAEEYDPDESE